MKTDPRLADWNNNRLNGDLTAWLDEPEDLDLETLEMLHRARQGLARTNSEEWES